MTGREEINRSILLKLKKKIEGNPLLQDFLTDMETSGLEVKTCQAYLNMVCSFLAFLKKDVRETTVSDINNYLLSLKKGDKPQTYLRTIWYCLNRFYGYLLRVGEVNENVMSKVTKPKAKPSREVVRTFLTPEELNMILNDANQIENEWFRLRNVAILRLMMETGIRCSAVTSINVDDYDIQNRQIKVTDKENKTTLFPISVDLTLAIGNWILIRARSKNLKPQEQALFLMENRHTRITSDKIEEIVKIHSQCIPNKHITPHKLRASFATNLYNMTGDIRLVQECMNHADISTTQLYIQSDGRNRKKATEIMSDLLKSGGDSQ